MNAILRKVTWAAMFGALMISPVAAVSTSGNVVLTATINDLTARAGSSHYTVAWVTKEDGTFIKTLWKQGDSSFTGGDWDHCTTWGTARGTSTAFDGYSTATAGNYNAVVPPAAGNNPIYVKWNCKDAGNAVVPDGTYHFYIQYAENITSPRNGPVTSALVWTKGPDAVAEYPVNEGNVSSPAGGNNFTDMSIVWTPEVILPPTYPEIAVEEPVNNDLANGAAVRNFGSLGVGSTSGVITFTIRNTGEGQLSGLTISKTGSHAADFLIMSAPAATVDSGASTSFAVAFKPTAPGSRSAVLHIASNDGDENPFDIQVSGTGTVAPEIVVEQPAGKRLKSGLAVVDCGLGIVGIGGTKMNFAVWNSGSADLTGIKVSVVGINAGDYQVTKPAYASLAPNACTFFDVIFKPTAIGTRTALVEIASNDGDESPFIINLTGAAKLPAPEIAVQQSSGGSLVDGAAKRSFGTVTIGRSKSKAFTIRNVGSATLKGLAITKDGANKGDFTVTPIARTSLAAGGKTTFRVTFKPGAKGTRNAAIHIRSNDANESPFDIRLAGAAVK
jgi:hypothetical protein